MGTLDEPRSLSPDVHIWTRSKLEWLDLTSFVGPEIPIYEEYYSRKNVWKKESLDRWKQLMASQFPNSKNLLEE